MKLEKIKSATLFCLVLISIILTTQIWLNISIEGIFIMSKKQENKSTKLSSSDNDKASLIKPEKLILNNNGKHTLLFNETEISSIYDRILEDTGNMLVGIFKSKEGIQWKKHSMDYIVKLRAGRTVELEFPFGYDYKTFANILGIAKAQWEEIKSIDTVLVGYDSNIVYIVDKAGDCIHEFSSKDLKSSTRLMADMINRGKTYSYIFLNEVDDERYGENVIIPIDIDIHTMEKLSFTPETYGVNYESIAAGFFDTNTSILRNFVDPAGTIVYTDGEKSAVSISKAGVIEYMSYSAQKKTQNDELTVPDAVNLATSFINDHMGFPKDSYLSSIEKVMKNNGQYSVVIRYNYRYEGIPIINNEIEADNSINIEIFNGEVTRYKRVVKNIEKTGEDRNIRNPLEIVDIFLKRLSYDKNINISNILIKDIYLSYFEYGPDNKTSLIPVWVIEAEGDLGAAGRYILNAESGDILSEPY